jgi:hypothetical protein
MSKQNMTHDLRIENNIKKSHKVSHHLFAKSVTPAAKGIGGDVDWSAPATAEVAAVAASALPCINRVSKKAAPSCQSVKRME